MNVFISWSGERSRHIATHLRDWIPKVIQSALPWMSQHDLAAGSRWSQEVATSLQDAKVGIICLTPENLLAPWIHFEAGAISKTIGASFVCPYLFEVSFSEVVGPLTQFQAKNADREGTEALIQMINNALPVPLKAEVLSTTFEVWWSKLENHLKKVPPHAAAKDVPRKEREILDEILALVRDQAKSKPPSLLAALKENTDVLIKAKDYEQLLRAWARSKGEPATEPNQR